MWKEFFKEKINKKILYIKSKFIIHEIYGFFCLFDGLLKKGVEKFLKGLTIYKS